MVYCCGEKWGIVVNGRRKCETIINGWRVVEAGSEMPVKLSGMRENIVENFVGATRTWGQSRC